MLYKKENVLNRGKRAIARFKTYWRVGSIITLSFVILGVISYIINEETRNSVQLPSFIVGETLLFSFGVFCLVYSFLRKYNPLLEGCKNIEKVIKKAVKTYNKTSKKSLKSVSKNSETNLTFTQCSTDFHFQELYDLLNKDNVDCIQYIGYPEVVITTYEVSEETDINKIDFENIFRLFKKK